MPLLSVLKVIIIQVLSIVQKTQVQKMGRMSFQDYHYTTTATAQDYHHQSPLLPPLPPLLPLEQTTQDYHYRGGTHGRPPSTRCQLCYAIQDYAMLCHRALCYATTSYHHYYESTTTTSYSRIWYNSDCTVYSMPYMVYISLFYMALQGLYGSIQVYSMLYGANIVCIRVYMGHFVSYLCPFRALLYGMALQGWSIMVYMALYPVELGHFYVFLEPLYPRLSLLAAKCAIYNHHLAANMGPFRAILTRKDYSGQNLTKI